VGCGSQPLLPVLCLDLDRWCVSIEDCGLGSSVSARSALCLCVHIVAPLCAQRVAAFVPLTLLRGLLHSALSAPHMCHGYATCNDLSTRAGCCCLWFECAGLVAAFTLPKALHMYKAVVNQVVVPKVTATLAVASPVLRTVTDKVCAC
jgi:hypothetical protein